MLAGMKATTEQWEHSPEAVMPEWRYRKVRDGREFRIMFNGTTRAEDWTLVIRLLGTEGAADLHEQWSHFYTLDEAMRAADQWHG
ncbi:hypothetical protein AU187_24450 [Mycobacterium sp. IS-1556]|nr:hypothetical protein AU187_24450 [Mycobacterium sp. IS-1556]